MGLLKNMNTCSFQNLGIKNKNIMDNDRKLKIMGQNIIFATYVMYLNPYRHNQIFSMRQIQSCAVVPLT